MTRKSTSPVSEPNADRRAPDRIDRKLLARLQQDGRTAISKLAREVNLTVTPTLERVRRLEAAGYIEGYFARLNPRKLGLGLLAYVEVSLDRTTPTPSSDSSRSCWPTTKSWNATWWPAASTTF